MIHRSSTPCRRSGSRRGEEVVQQHVVVAVLLLLFLRLLLLVGAVLLPLLGCLAASTASFPPAFSSALFPISYAHLMES